MAEITTVIDNLVEAKLLTLHTAFLSVVLSVNTSNYTATVQPLVQAKQAGKKGGIKYPVLSNIPVMKNAMYKITGIYDGKATATRLSVGDVVLCVACERDITDAKKGKSALPRINGHHQLQDAIVVGAI